MGRLGSAQNTIGVFPRSSVPGETMVFKWTGAYYSTGFDAQTILKVKR